MKLFWAFFVPTAPTHRTSFCSSSCSGIQYSPWRPQTHSWYERYSKYSFPYPCCGGTQSFTLAPSHPASCSLKCLLVLFTVCLARWCFKNGTLSQAWRPRLLIPAHWKQRQSSLCCLKASLVYIDISRPATKQPWALKVQPLWAVL